MEDRPSLNPPEVLVGLLGMSVMLEVITKLYTYLPQVLQFPLQCSKFRRFGSYLGYLRMNRFISQIVSVPGKREQALNSVKVLIAPQLNAPFY